VTVVAGAAFVLLSAGRLLLIRIFRAGRLLLIRILRAGRLLLILLAILVFVAILALV